MNNIGAVIVGIDGSAGAQAALMWAADEARLRQSRLVLIHAVDDADLALAHHGGPALRAIDDVAERILIEHAVLAADRQPSVPVTTVLSHSRPADALLELSGEASLLVVGTIGRGGVVSTVLGSVSHRVAAHAQCPVAVVPVQPALRGCTVAAKIILGLSEGPAGADAAEFAFAEAARRGAVVVAVRAQRAPEPGPLDDSDFALIARSQSDAREQMEAELARWRARYPGVVVEAHLIGAEATDELLGHARAGQLLVIGCHHSNDRWSMRLGSVPSAILHRSPCPVVVVSADDADRATRQKISADTRSL